MKKRKPLEKNIFSSLWRFWVIYLRKIFCGSPVCRERSGLCLKMRFCGEKNARNRVRKIFILEYFVFFHKYFGSKRRFCFEIRKILLRGSSKSIARVFFTCLCIANWYIWLIKSFEGIDYDPAAIEQQPDSSTTAPAKYPYKRLYLGTAYWS